MELVEYILPRNLCNHAYYIICIMDSLKNINSAHLLRYPYFRVFDTNKKVEILEVYWATYPIKHCQINEIFSCKIFYISNHCSIKWFQILMKSSLSLPSFYKSSISLSKVMVTTHVIRQILWIVCGERE